MTDYSIWITIIVIAECFLKNAILGIVKSLERQKTALYLNTVIYVGITIPLVYFFAFEVQKYGWFVDLDRGSTGAAATNNRGVAIWIAFVIGSGLQNIGYFFIIWATDWGWVSRMSRRRFQELSVQYSDNYDILSRNAILFPEDEDDIKNHSYDHVPYGDISKASIGRWQLNRT